MWGSVGAIGVEGQFIVVYGSSDTVYYPIRFTFVDSQTLQSPRGWRVIDWVAVRGTEMWVVYEYKNSGKYDTVLVQLPFTTGQCCKFKDRAVSKIYCGVITPYVPPVAPDTPTFCNDLATIQQSWVWAYNRQRLEDSVRRYIVPQIEAVCQSVTDSLWWRIKQPEFAFTLYYYDRAGNRVAVVPPDGVEMLSDAQTALVPQARATGDTLRPRHRKVVLWRYTASNQVWMRHHPDRGTDLTWYDPADRPIATQDARQRAENKVSFIKYDSLSRPIEGGVATLNGNFVNFAYENNVPINTSIVWDRFVQVYDTAVAGSPITSGHFRGRVTTHKVWQKWTGTEEPDYIVYYDYDLIGRVKREIHEIPMLKRFKHDKFEMVYLYDAISGKVREMRYNVGKKDQFFHKFAYDAMGNLKYVWTSRNGKHWTLESALKYYPDGKLMRREIRPKDLMLQGLDYAYTLDGWLKAINSEVLANDPSKDGISGTYQYFAKDVFSLLLRYYPNDYRPIKPTATPLEAAIISGNSRLYKPYYTGWISSWSLHLDTLHTAYSFRYDRLGRLTKATTLEGFDGTEWNANLVKNYSTKYSYDLVGNILSLTRYGSDTNAIDILTYEYYNRSRNNRLKRIIDGAGRMIGIDLETQPMDNYNYDPVGNMIEDKSRNMEVLYTYSNRPKRIKIGNMTINMLYNPSGYRFFNGSGSGNGEIFIYNSQGQLMAKYSIGGNTLKLDYMPIYEGTKRLGVLEPDGVEWRYCPPGQICLVAFNPCLSQLGVPMGPCGRGVVYKAMRKYELTDHLGNVRVVIRAQRVPVSTDGSTVTYYKPLVHEISDYYPYGWQKVLGKYQFGANAGSLFEDWDSTRGTYYTLYRLLDARVARWYQVEPLWESYAWMSPYVVNSGNPVIYFDILGDKIKGFWIDSAGNVKYNPEEASEDAIELWEAMKQTPTGEYYFKRLIEVPTEVEIRIKNKPLIEGQYSKTDILDYGEENSPYFRKVRIVLSRNVTRGRKNVFRDMGVESWVRLNLTGIHEAVHVVDEENVKLKKKHEFMVSKSLEDDYKLLQYEYDLEVKPIEEMIKSMREMGMEESMIKMFEERADESIFQPILKEMEEIKKEIEKKKRREKKDN